ncbi:RNA-binding protein 44 isoform X2 [Anoplopoma fimbria]|uniref:RNA-binding protein 44 isoform X2 n=1 Tax=Anoplopoma fimbria TaxID=229290 RepID=UPI0023EA913B|nr:RNA-binding protein 44 isoform X2 [Anoplopoma fimbria]
MAAFHTGWPGWPSYSHMAREYAGVVVPSHHVIPCFYNMVVEKPSPKENRIFLLDRSVFDLVDDHKFLSLTDPKLLGWYLCLSPEDRKIIQDGGGFQQFLLRHPALELSRHHVYVKRYIPSVVPAQPTMTSNRPTHVSQSRTSGATQSDFERLPNNVRETLNLLGCYNSGDGSQKPPTAFNSSTTQELNQQKVHTMRASSHLYEQRPSWEMANCSAAVCKDSAALSSFSLDTELDGHRRGWQPDVWSQTARTQGQSATCSYTEVSLLQSEWPTIESSEYYSFDSIQMGGREHSDRSIIQPAEIEQASSPLDPVKENSTEERQQDQMVRGCEYAEGDDEASLSFGDQSDNFHSIMENDKSILVCLTSGDVKALKAGVHSGPVQTDSGALEASSETSKSDQCVTKMNAAEDDRSPVPRVTTCDTMVGTELALSTSAITQTEDPETADKHIITEVHMADLDYLAEEFIKLKMVREKLRSQKEEMKSAGCKLRKECDCLQRAQRAELGLLALQYSMCTQHCWRLHYISSEGGQLPAMPKDPSANIASVLQKLESDYNQMRGKIRAGVPLEKLKPLSVDPEKITTCASYIPAKIMSDVLGNVPSGSSQEPQRPKTGEERGCPNIQSTNGSQHSERKEKEKRIKMENSKAGRAVPLVPHDGDATHNAHKPEENQTPACQELNTCESWFDAEENLQPAEPAVEAETGQDPTVMLKDKTYEIASEEVSSSVLCVSNLPSDVTESDVMLWFEKYHPSEVSISALKNHLSVAIVTVSGPQSAEAAARELHGCCKQGHTLHVEHINGSIGGSQSQSSASISGPESSKDSTEPPTSKTEIKLITQPLLSSSIKNRQVVCISPTAKGTCVPQHYGTMGSFDTLMAELTQLHPAVGRQRIVDALMELKAKHRGVLSGLPLRTIREMTSQLLTRPESPTEL